MKWLIAFLFQGIHKAGGDHGIVFHKQNFHAESFLNLL